jgi:tetratricopeptide (TPR) repeat protein
MARRAGDLDVAEKLYEEIIVMEPGYAPPYYEFSWLLRQLGESEGAIKAIESALSLHSSPPASYYYRAGRIYEWAGKRGESFAAYRQAANLAPDDSRIMEALKRIQGQ